MELQGKWKLDIPNKEVENGLKTLLEWYTPVFSSETGTICEFAVRDSDFLKSLLCIRPNNLPCSGLLFSFYCQKHKKQPFHRDFPYR